MSEPLYLSSLSAFVIKHLSLVWFGLKGLLTGMCGMPALLCNKHSEIVRLL